jgi:short-subunit dehydrogenase
MNVSGAVTIVTGASEGIGLATARLFARHGAKVALVARSADKIGRLAYELNGSFAYSADMRDEGAIRGMVEGVQRHYGRIDCLINNAGQGMWMPLEHTDLEQYRAIMQLNVFGVLAAMQAVVPIMRRQGGGVIVNISSGVSKRYIPGLGAYASTKYALNALTLTARAELAGDNIQVGVMYPSLTDTDFGKNGARSTRPEGVPGVGRPPGGPAAQMHRDTPEQVAEKILEAVETEAPEVYVDIDRP